MKLVPRRALQVQQRSARIAGIDRSGSVPLYPEGHGEAPTWDTLPPELRRWVDTSLPVSGQFDASYVPPGDTTFLAWGTLPRAVAVLSATRASIGSPPSPTWNARATIVPAGRAHIKRATLPAVPASVASADSSKNQAPCASFFSNLPSIAQRAIEQAISVPSSESGYTFFTAEYAPAGLIVTQQLWYQRQTDSLGIAGAYASRSTRLPADHDGEAAMRLIASSMHPWSTIAFRAEIDWSYGVSARVSTSSHSVLPLTPGEEARPQLKQ